MKRTALSATQAGVLAMGRRMPGKTWWVLPVFGLVLVLVGMAFTWQRSNETGAPATRLSVSDATPRSEPGVTPVTEIEISSTVIERDLAEPALAVRPPSRPSDPYAGFTYRDGDPAVEIVNGVCVTAACDYALDQVIYEDDELVWLVKRDGARFSNTVISSLDVPESTDSTHLMLAPVLSNGTEDSRLIALVNVADYDDGVYTSVDQAWRVNERTGRFTATSTRGLVISQSFHCDIGEDWLPDQVYADEALGNDVPGVEVVDRESLDGIEVVGVIDTDAGEGAFVVLQGTEVLEIRQLYTTSSLNVELLDGGLRAERDSGYDVLIYWLNTESRRLEVAS